MFRQRSGAHDPQEYSPVFVQFLDCVWQIWRQFPWEFEFTDQLLLTLIYAVVSRFSEDFIFDHDQQRLHHRTVWRQIIRENNCPQCQKRRREKLGSFATAISREDQSIRESEASSFSDNLTWKTVGGVGTSPSPWRSVEETVDPEGGADEEPDCEVCRELLAQSSTSIWHHVAHNLDAFVNPIYTPSPTGRLPSAASGEELGDSFLCERSEPIFFGGSYHHSAVPHSHSRPRGNTASDQDLGIHTRLPSHRSQLPKNSSDFDGLERLYGDFSPPIPPLGLDGGELVPEGISLPKQLFVTASQAHQFYQRTTSASAPASSSSSAQETPSAGPPQRSDREPPPSDTPPESSAKTAPSALPPDESQQSVFFLMPSFDVQHLAIWESAYFSGVPTLKSFASPSAAFTKGILASRNEACASQAALLEWNEELKTKVNELSHQISLLQQRHSSSSSTAPGHHQSSKGFDDFEMLDGDEIFGSPPSGEEEEAGESESRIISTGMLFEDYIPPPPQRLPHSLPTPPPAL
jgi:hypothetical protein